MDRSDFERALSEISVLLENPRAKEPQFQSWFERHPIIFKAYGYQRYLTQPVIKVGDEEYIPDFIVQRLDGLWEILELKRPDTPVLRDRDRRQSFYAAFESYVEQCRDYSKAFLQNDVREQFNQKYGANVQDSVASVIVAGRRAEFDFQKANEKFFDRSSKVTLQTYDDVRQRLEFYRAEQFAQNELQPGLFLQLLLVPRKLPDRANYLLDFGVDLERNRISIYINAADEICFRVIDSKGNQYLTKSPMEKSGVLYGTIVHLVFELAMANDYSYAAIEVNGRYLEDRRLDKLEFDTSIFRCLVLGSDVIGQERSEMSLLIVAFMQNTWTFSQRQELRDWVATKFAEYFEHSGYLPNRWTFTGSQYFFTSDHPNFLDKSICGVSWKPREGNFTFVAISPPRWEEAVFLYRGM